MKKKKCIYVDSENPAQFAWLVQLGVEIPDMVNLVYIHRFHLADIKQFEDS